MKTQMKHKGVTYDLLDDRKLDKLLHMLEKEPAQKKSKSGWKLKFINWVSFGAIYLLIAIGILALFPKIDRSNIELIVVGIIFGGLILYCGATMLFDHLWFMRLEMMIRNAQKLKIANKASDPT
jgi:hypothetical protein